MDASQGSIAVSGQDATFTKQRVIFADPTLGSELLTDPEFNTDDTSSTGQYEWTWDAGTYNILNGKLNEIGSGYSNASNTLSSVTPGKIYRVQYKILNDPFWIVTMLGQGTTVGTIDLGHHSYWRTATNGLMGLTSEPGDAPSLEYMRVAEVLTAFNVTGSDTSFDITLSASSGSLDITGQASVLNHTMVAGQGQIDVIGYDVLFDHTALGGIDAQSGSFSLSFSDIVVAHTTALDSENFTTSGSLITLDHIFVASQGSIQASGSDASLEPTDASLMETGNFLVASPALLLEHTLSLDSISINITFPDVELLDRYKTKIKSGFIKYVAKIVSTTYRSKTRIGTKVGKSRVSKYKTSTRSAQQKGKTVFKTYTAKAKSKIYRSKTANKTDISED